MQCFPSQSVMHCRFWEKTPLRGWVDGARTRLSHSNLEVNKADSDQSSGIFQEQSWVKIALLRWRDMRGRETKIASNKGWQHSARQLDARRIASPLWVNGPGVENAGLFSGVLRTQTSIRIKSQIGLLHQCATSGGRFDSSPAFQRRVRWQETQPRPGRDD